MESYNLMQNIEIRLEQSWGNQEFFNQNFGSILSAPHKLTGLIFFYSVWPILLFLFSPNSWTKKINFQFSCVLINGGWLLAFGLQILVKLTGLIFFYSVRPILLFLFSPNSWTKKINFQFSCVLINGGWLLAFGLQILVTIRLTPKSWYWPDRTDQNCHWPDEKRDTNLFGTVELGRIGPPVRDPWRSGQYLSWVANSTQHNNSSIQLFFQPQLTD